MKQNRLINKFIGDKNFYIKTLGIVVPIIIQNLITNFVNLLDNIMVGQIGTDQMNGVSIVNQLMFVFNLCVFGAVSGAGIFTAQYYGKGDDEGVRNTFRAKIILLAVVMAVAMAVFIGGGDFLIMQFLHETDGIGNASATLSAGHSYLIIMLIGLPAFAMGQCYSNTLRDIGETVVPMVGSVAAVFVNLVLNYILIFGHFGVPALGVDGAAYATIISRYLEVFIVMLWTHMHKEKNAFIVGAYKTLRIPASLMKQIIIKGSPLAINEALWAMGITMMNQNYSLRGLSVVAALNISSTISNLFSVIYFSMGDAIAIIVGQLLGANKMKEARDTDNKLIAMGVMSCLVVGTLMGIFRGTFPAIYNTEQEVKDLAAYMILITAIMMPFYSILHSSYFTIRTGGQTFITFLFDSGFIWCISVPVAFLLTHFTSIPIEGVYPIVCSMDLIKVIIGIVLVKKGVWMRNIVNI